MRAVLSVLGCAALIGITATAIWASSTGWRISGRLDKPVSVREGSVHSPRGGNGMALYYFGSGRGHVGGGYNFGK